MPSRQLTDLIPVGGGFDPEQDPLQLTPDQSPRGENAVHNRSTIYRRHSLYHTEAFLPTLGFLDSPIMGLGVWLDPAGTNYLMLHTDTGQTQLTDGVTDWRTVLAADEPNAQRYPVTNCNSLDHYFFARENQPVCVYPSSPVALMAGYVKDETGFAAASGVPVWGKYIASYAGRIFIGHTKEDPAGGTAYQWYRQRVRWCQDSDYTKWRSGTDAGAGGVDLADTPGEVVGLYPFQGMLAVFKDDVIVMGQETGDINFPMAWPTTIRAGCLSGRSIQPIGDGLLMFLGTDNFYVLDGATPRPVGSAVIRELLFQLNSASTRLAFSWCDYNDHTYHFAIPVREGDAFDPDTTTVQIPARIYSYDWEENKWYVWTWPSGMTSAVWAQINAPSGSLNRALSLNRSYIGLACGLTGGGYDYGLFTLDDRDITEPEDGTGPGTHPVARASMYYETPDVRLNPEGHAQLYCVYLHGEKLEFGDTVEANFTVEVSVDRGQTWTPATLGSEATTELTKRSFYCNVFGETFRLRITLDRPGVTITGWRADFAPRSPKR